jgi:hypothetical protein
VAVGVVAHALLANPDGGGPALGEERDGLVGDVGARSEQQRADGGGGDVDDAALVECGDRVAVAVDEAPFEVDERDAFLRPGQLWSAWWRGSWITAHAG